MFTLPENIASFNAAPLECLGPDINLTHAVVQPKSNAYVEEQVKLANKHSVVTVMLRRRNVKDTHTLSFIIDSSQVLPWVNAMAKGLTINQTSFLVTHPGKLSADMASADILKNVQQDAQSQVVAELSVTRISKGQADPTEEEQSNTANTYREAGNDLFKGARNFKEYRKAHAVYSRALNYGPTNDEKLRIKIRSNMAIISLRTMDYPFTNIDTWAAEALLDHNEHLEQDFRAKLIFRRATALFNTEFYIRALHEMKEAARLKPRDKMILDEQKHFLSHSTDLFEKRRKEFAEIYNVMIQSPLFKNPLLS